MANAARLLINLSIVSLICPHNHAVQVLVILLRKLIMLCAFVIDLKCVIY